MTTTNATAGTLCPLALSVQGGMLEIEIRRMMRTWGYAPVYLQIAVEHVEAYGCAWGCEGLEPADADAIDGLLMSRLGEVEGGPSKWVAAFDRDRWVLTPEPTPNVFDAATAAILAGGNPA